GALVGDPDDQTDFAGEEGHGGSVASAVGYHGSMADLNTLPLERLYGALASGGLVQRALELARDEDLGSDGDITSAACIEAGARGEGAIVAREAGVAAGLAALPELLEV